jgi:hypothetical protein
MKLYTYLATEVVATRNFALSAMIARWNVAKIWFWLGDGVGKQFVHCLNEANSTYRHFLLETLLAPLCRIGPIQSSTYT